VETRETNNRSQNDKHIITYVYQSVISNSWKRSGNKKVIN